MNPIRQLAQIGLILTLSLLLPLALRAEDSKDMVNISLETLNGRVFKFTYPVDRQQAGRMRASPDAVRLFVARAKRDYTRKHIGYNESVHGENAYLMVPGLTVSSMSLEENGRSTTLKVDAAQLDP